MRFIRFSLACFALSTALAGCVIQKDEPKTGAKASKLEILSTKADGDFRMSGRLGLDAGKLKITLAAIRDPDALIHPADPAKVKFTVSAAGKDMSCTVAKVSASAKAEVDLVFVNDTTGSMSGTVEGINDSVQKFAEDVAAGGVDARFSMVTYGDAFATKAADSTFKIGLGDGAPPDFDSDERPYVGLSDLDTFKGFLGELKASSVLGSGGGDSEENTIGALDWASKKSAWRDGAARMFVSIGDNPSHQAGDGTTDIVAPWAPPTGDSVVNALAGTAVVHVVGHDEDRDKFYNLKGLADGTGGAFLDLPSDGVVDLTKLSLKDWLTSAFAGSCEDPTTGRYTITLQATVSGSKAFVGTLTFDVSLS
jgi:hypothetical protein